MKLFLTTLPANIIECFRRRRLPWHAAAILLTFILVISGFDWNYFLFTRSPVLQRWMFPAVVMGGLLPIILPLCLIAVGSVLRVPRIRLAGWAVGQAEIIAAFVAALYKAMTGRAHPMRVVGEDLTHLFRFGLLRGGVFWGWPSSHTTIAFAMAVTLFTLFRKEKWLRLIAIAYATYIGVGVSTTIHWFSDFAAGAIFGTLVGLIVGEKFARDRTEFRSGEKWEPELPPLQ